MGNYKDWIKTIDINIDYYSAFVKSWIAFNSWYRDAYDANLSDAAVIEKIKTEHNIFKTSIINLLTAVDLEGTAFRENIGKLHIALEASTIMSQERTKDRVPISFNSIALVNPNNKVTGIKIWYDEISIERTRVGVNTSIKKSKTGATIFNFVQERFDLDELSINPQFTALRSECQRKCIELYRSVSPYLIETVLTNSSPNIECSSVRFVNDITKVSRGVIDVLYLLRCSLMHGDVHLNNTTLEVYKYSYYVLSAILKKLL